MREQELLDYHYEEIIRDELEKIKKKKKIIGGIKRSIARNHTFQCLSSHVVKGAREMIRKVHETNERN